MLRRSLFGQLFTLAGATAALGHAGQVSAQQQAQTPAEPIDLFRFVGPEDDPVFGPLLRGDRSRVDAIGVGPSRHEEVAAAFRILFSQSLRDRAAVDGHLGAARWFEELRDTNRRNPPERYNAQWREAANPLITAFFGLTNTRPAFAEYLNGNGDETDWCAAFVNICLYLGNRRGTFSPMSGSFRRYGEPTTDPKPGDIVVFSKVGELGQKGFGHVGFFVRREGSSIVVIGGNQFDTPGSPNAVTERPYPAQGRRLELHSYRKVPAA